jgi:hypothetical protein
MPITYRIDTKARIVVAAGHGALTDADVFGYQCDAWSRPEVRGFDELVDMTGVTEIVLPSTSRVRDLAALAADMDHPTQRTKFAIVAPASLSFGLGRMFQMYRELNPGSTKEVRVFKTLDEALKFLGVEGPIEMPDPGEEADR